MSNVPSPTADELVHSPAWLPLEVAPGDAVRLVQLDEAAYGAASFLDQRLLGMGYPQGTCKLSVLDAAAARLAPPAHYIFHTGHVGSTLISRLIGARERFFCLREPALLRPLAALSPAAATRAPALGVALALLGRSWRPGQCAVIKATSFVSELAEAILATDSRAAALFMFVRPLTYLRTILAGPNSRVESRHLASARLQRLVRRLGAAQGRDDPRSEGESIAMSWLCEMAALHQAALRFERQVLWMDFDAFLADPRAGLRLILQTLGESPAAADIDALVAGPLMRQYSKAPEHAYDTELRREVLLSADAEHAAQIRRGLDWLQRVAMHHRLAEAILHRAVREGA
ncbi:MAG TPA: hypothetical protein VKB72_08080 [Steroidobacteraceae bacterium]|nr:hypothetical protein [Steroidobacteraceae bacterium]